MQNSNECVCHLGVNHKERADEKQLMIDRHVEQSAGGGCSFYEWNGAKIHNHGL